MIYIIYWIQIAINFILMKPLKRSFIKIMNKHELKDSEVAIIGDQFLTDIIGGNKVGITTILVNPIGDSKFELSRLNRKLESVVINHLTKKDLFKRGRYYE